MKKTDINSKKGFTIIEVVLVLAIAGLIFLMVFVAYPALRRNQSDTQRRNDLSRFVSQLAQYKANNRKVPRGNATGVTDMKDFMNGYLDADVKVNGSTIENNSETNNKFVDPDGEPYIPVLGELTQTGTTSENTLTLDEVDHNIYYFTHATCDGEKATYSPGKNDVAIQYRMENGVYCQSNAE